MYAVSGLLRMSNGAMEIVDLFPICIRIYFKLSMVIFELWFGHGLVMVIRESLIFFNG